jgi:hypothetical protein
MIGPCLRPSRLLKITFPSSRASGRTASKIDIIAFFPFLLSPSKHSELLFQDRLGFCTRRGWIRSLIGSVAIAIANQLVERLGDREHLIGAHA